MTCLIRIHERTDYFVIRFSACTFIRSRWNSNGECKNAGEYFSRGREHISPERFGFYSYVSRLIIKPERKLGHLENRRLVVAGQGRLFAQYFMQSYKYANRIEIETQINRFSLMELAIFVKDRDCCKAFVELCPI